MPPIMVSTPARPTKQTRHNERTSLCSVCPLRSSKATVICYTRSLSLPIIYSYLLCARPFPLTWNRAYILLSFCSCSLFSNTANHSTTENKEYEGSRSKAWAILRLLVVRPLGGSLGEGKHMKGARLYFILTTWKKFFYSFSYSWDFIPRGHMT